MTLDQGIQILKGHRSNSEGQLSNAWHLTNGALYFSPKTFALFIAKASPRSMTCLLRRALVTGSTERAFVGKLAIPSLKTPCISDC